MMRVRSGLQRFPVAQWVEDLEILQSKSIDAHTKSAFSLGSVINFGLSRRTTPATTAANTPYGTQPNSLAPSRANSVFNSPFQTPAQSRAGSRANSPTRSPVQSRAPSPSRDGEQAEEQKRHSPPYPGRRNGRPRPAQSIRSASGISRNGSFASLHAALENNIPADHAAGRAIPENEEDHSNDNVLPPIQNPFDDDTHPPMPTPFDRRVNSCFQRPRAGTTLTTPGSPMITPSPSRPSTPPPGPDGRPIAVHRSRSVLSLHSIVGEQTDFKLQKVDPFFTDPTGEFFNSFEKSLDSVTAKNSESKYCIEKFLVKSEKNWFAQRHAVKLGKSAPSSSAASMFRVPRATARSLHNGSSSTSPDRQQEHDAETGLTQYALGTDFKPFQGLKRIMQLKIGDWQVYTILLALVS